MVKIQFRFPRRPLQWRRILRPIRRQPPCPENPPDRIALQLCCRDPKVVSPTPAPRYILLQYPRSQTVSGIFGIKEGYVYPYRTESCESLDLCFDLRRITADTNPMHYIWYSPLFDSLFVALLAFIWRKEAAETTIKNKSVLIVLLLALLS